jgi:diketogulonate reductase-like aldo/keto reductase
MAYSPLDEGRLARHPALAPLAAGLGCSAAQIALAWLLRQPDVIAIPKAASPAHARANRDAADITLEARPLAAIDTQFAPPRRKVPLEMI